MWIKLVLSELNIEKVSCWMGKLAGQKDMAALLGEIHSCIIKHPIEGGRCKTLASMSGWAGDNCP